MRITMNALATLTALSICMPAVILSSPEKARASLFEEHFENNALDPRISITTIGSFNSAPGIVDVTAFGSTRAFAFGVSSCAFNCFGNFATTLSIDLLAPSFVSTISFKELERYDNWGSDGVIFVDGVPLFSGINDFGRLPYNDRQQDVSYRDRTFAVNREVRRIDLLVGDITNLSEIVIDDIVIVPEPSTTLLILLGLTVLSRRSKEF